jgi:hypothetical protein
MKIPISPDHLSSMGGHVRIILLRVCAVALTIPLLMAQNSRLNGKDYAERSDQLIRYFASASPKNPNFPKDAMPYHAARLELGSDMPGTLKSIEKMLDVTLKSRPDPFHLHACIHAYFRHREKLTPSIREKIKKLAASWTYSKPIGVSLNYELMRDGAGYLAAQEWPDLVDAAGNDANKIKKNCEGWLWRIWRDTTNRNASEYDAPIYYGTDFAPTRMIAEYSRDPQMSMAAKMTLDFMLIHTGAHWHNGYHISSAGRGKYWGSLNLGPDAAAPTNGMAYLFFGSYRPFNIASAPQAYWLAHPGKSLSHALLTSWQASLPETRTVLATHIWPGHDAIVHKYAWFDKNYGLASQRDDGTSYRSYLFKECRRTMLKWQSDKPASSFTVIQQNRRRPQEKIGNAFAYGENPYCQVMQHRGTLLGVYDVPEEYGFWITRAPFSTTGAIIAKTERGGWVICHGGSMLFAFRFMGQARWDKPDTRERLELWRCDDKRGGWILETAPLAKFAGGGAQQELQRFGDALLQCKINDQTKQSPPKLSFRNLNGDTMEIDWKPLIDPLKDECRVNGKSLKLEEYSLLKCPHAMQPNGGALTLSLPNGNSITYDFKNWKILTNGK